MDNRTEKKPEIYKFWSRLDRAIDGDTYEVFCDVGFAQYAHPAIRLDGVDTPEIFGEQKPYGEKAKAFVEQVFADNNNEMYVYTKFNQSFNRWVGDIYIQGKSLADIIIENGYDKESMLKEE